VERTAGARRNRRAGKENRKHDRGFTLGQLATAVAYHYGLTPAQIADFSGPQLIMWYEHACIGQSEEKLLDLDITMMPHFENRDTILRDLRRSLQEAIEKRK
jgi:hypothetical protein